MTLFDTQLNLDDPDTTRELEYEIAALIGRRGATIDHRLGGPREVAACTQAIEILRGEMRPEDCSKAARALIPDRLLAAVYKARRDA